VKACSRVMALKRMLSLGRTCGEGCLVFCNVLVEVTETVTEVTESCQALV
jgi:hypothetical protein